MGVNQRGSVWWMGFRDEGGRWRRVSTPARNKKEALAFLAEKRAQVFRAKANLEPVLDQKATLRELLEWWLDEKCPEASRKKDRTRIETHILKRGLGLADVPLYRVTSNVIASRFEDMEKDGLAPATINRLRASLHSAYRKAAAPPARWPGANPISAIPPLKVVKREYVTLPEAVLVHVLEQHVPEQWMGPVACAIFLGLRKGEILGLKKQDVTLGLYPALRVGRSHRRNITKGGTIDHLPISPKLLPYILTAVNFQPRPRDGEKVARATDILFPDVHGKQRTEESDPHLVWRHALRRAGIVDHWETWCRRCKAEGRAVDPGRHPGPNALVGWLTPTAPEGLRCEIHGSLLWVHAEPLPMRFHDLRHSLATNLDGTTMSGQPSAVMRHSSESFTRTQYVHHRDAEHLRELLSRPVAPISELPALSVTQLPAETPETAPSRVGVAQSRHSVAEQTSSKTA